MTTPGTDDTEVRTAAIRALKENEKVQDAAFGRYQDALLSRGLPEPLSPYRQVPRAR